MNTGRNLHKTIPFIFSSLWISYEKQNIRSKPLQKNEIMSHTNIQTLKTWKLPSKSDRNIFDTVKLVGKQHLNTQRKRQRDQITVKLTRNTRNVWIKQKRNFLISTTITCNNLHCVSRNFYDL